MERHEAQAGRATYPEPQQGRFTAERVGDHAPPVRRRQGQRAPGDIARTGVWQAPGLAGLLDLDGLAMGKEQPGQRRERSLDAGHWLRRVAGAGSVVD